MKEPPGWSPTPDSPSTPALTILLAEDEANLRAMLAIVLRREGHRIAELRNGAELREQLEAIYRPTEKSPTNVLVICDLRLPEVDALTLLRALRVRGHAPPFILLTAFGGPEVHAAAAELGALKVLDKPFDFDELREVVRLFQVNETRPGPGTEA